MDGPQHWRTHLSPRSPGSFPLPEPGTLAGAWTAALTPDPDRPLLWGLVGGGPARWVTRGEFLDRTVAAAGRLSAAGLVAGDRVLVSGPSTVDLAVAHVACLRLGLVVVPTNGAYREAELAHVLADCRPRAALVDHDRWADLVTDLQPNLLVAATDLQGLEVPGGASGVDGPAPELDSAGPDDPAIIGYTSGTTGRPKGAVLTQANLLAGAHSVRVAWRWTDADRLVLCLPLFHMHGLGVGLHGTLLAAASAILQPRFDPDSVLDAVEAAAEEAADTAAVRGGGLSLWKLWAYAFCCPCGAYTTTTPRSLPTRGSSSCSWAAATLLIGAGLGFWPVPRPLPPPS